MKLLKLILILLIGYIGNCQETTNNFYIKISFGSLNKAIPKVVISVDSFHASDIFFVARHLRVNKCELALMQSRILTNKFVYQVDSSKTGYYNIELVTDQGIVYYNVYEREYLGYLFDQIIKEVGDEKRQIKFESELKLIFKLLHNYG